MLSVLSVSGALVIFTALLSVAFLHRTMKRYEWFGIAILTLGLVIVGVGDYLFNGDARSQNDANSIVTGKFFFCCPWTELDLCD
jgi:drug/metabolite transporter (DMT)-like permease